MADGAKKIQIRVEKMDLRETFSDRPILRGKQSVAKSSGEMIGPETNRRRPPKKPTGCPSEREGIGQKRSGSRKDSKSRKKMALRETFPGRPILRGERP